MIIFLRSIRYALIGLLAFAAGGFALPSVSAERFDIVIKQGRIIDGSGAPWYVADVGIREGRIVKIGRLSADDAEETIDAKGLIVAPGFIDMMGQTATPMLEDPKTALNLLTQGITTINAGEGGSAAPLDAAQGRREGWTTMSEYFALLDLEGLPVNVVQTVGHTQVRRIVMGDVDRRPSDEELAAMQELVREAMEAGAIGVSTALIYPPAVYARTREIAALSAVAGEYGGRYYTHMRNEGDRLLEAIDEALEIGREAETPVHIFHLKAAGQQNWGKMQQAIARIKAARAEGHQVTADIYPYINNGLGIAAMIHPRHFSGGYDRLRNRLDDVDLRAEIRREMESTDGWENWYRHAGHDWNRVIVGQSEDRRYRDVLGQSLQSIAEAKQEDPWETFFNLASTGAFVLPQSMSEANKILAMQHPFVSFCTDVGPAGGSRSASHPRGYGSFPRLFSRYVRELGVISPERAVAQASAAAANAVMAYDRGRIAEGLAADLVIFDQQRIVDRADFTHPDAVSEGVTHVIVNGRIALSDGEWTGIRAGKVIRGPGYKASKSPAELSTGTLVEEMHGFDEVIRDMVRRQRTPGAAIAVSDEGRLVYARGFGYADLAASEPVQPDSLFRIASISKPITAVAVLRLIEAGKLGLDDKIFEVLDYESDIEAAGDAFDPRLREITIRHLLQHRGGWDRDQSFDAMFQAVRFAEQMGESPPADQQTVIRAMFSQSLDFEPGERYAYSNFGYCLLGRAVEQVSGQEYEAYVKEQVLAPLGITSMRLGSTRRSERCEGEVCYYHPDHGDSVFADDLGRRVPSAYGAWNFEAMDSHGGWLASAIDLARFATTFDNPDDCPILSRESIELMHARPEGLAGYDAEGEPKTVYYSLGWSNRVLRDGGRNHWHGGSLPGTATILIRRHDGRNFVALLNTRVNPGKRSLSGIVDETLGVASRKVDRWPQHDLFD